MLIQPSKCPKCGQYTVILGCWNCGYETKEGKQMRIEGAKMVKRINKLMKEGKLSKDMMRILDPQGYMANLAGKK